ncbi:MULTISPECIES: AGE family epimerase/isomerase [unclassified Streptomyces]|uniref:AGE family epimerase/isomerase n=1 Tax=unclassified Streptomyces TaxID=2593676 RepID=UPI001BEB8364|nr:MULTISPECIES: AGE family epimerase/isomerase [unclassified Streptomyces]MBT2405535.1 AGE family epimerase/isomerase [Streptomyces sp. ISL-21]MBT2607786.1 AGE family epimerase/isomerase [Streptomyces sp. ISL-87]
MSNTVNFTFSDTIAGRATAFDKEARSFTLTTADGRDFEVALDGGPSAELLHNLGEPYQDASGHIDALLEEGRFVFAYGVFYPNGEAPRFEAKRLIFVGRQGDDYRFEEDSWWIRQIEEIAAFYRKAQFGNGPVDFSRYRTDIRLGGEKTASHVQETDTISRLVYGMASAFLLTGDDQYLEVAERGTEYLREHMRFVDTDENVVYWYHGLKVDGDTETKLFTSEFSDDYDALPAYEQIYALAGPVQTYRITGDPRIKADADATIRLFDRFYLDPDEGGYFSHIDPILLSPEHASLGPNRARKNWNSVGDHAPAYLINLYLATGEKSYADMLEYTFDTIVERFPDTKNSPFVQERFHKDWSHDTTHGWQQDRAVIGHNLKIAWNLMRMHSLRAKDAYIDTAVSIGETMPAVGADRQRGGWYDVVERLKAGQEEQFRFAWHDRKAWWQQEQAILAYLILHGTTGREEFATEARDAQSFYNAFFLDHDEGAVYFNTLASGLPYLLGVERLKGSHSMSMYHSAELCYLAAVYNNLLVNGKAMDFWFKPDPALVEDRLLRVSPDLLPAGSVRIESVEIDGERHTDYDSGALTVRLPETSGRVKVKVRLAANRTTEEVAR